MTSSCPFWMHFHDMKIGNCFRTNTPRIDPCLIDFGLVLSNFICCLCFQALNLFVNLSRALPEPGVRPTHDIVHVLAVLVRDQSRDRSMFSPNFPLHFVSKQFDHRLIVGVSSFDH